MRELGVLLIFSLFILGQATSSSAGAASEGAVRQTELAPPGQSGAAKPSSPSQSTERPRSTAPPPQPDTKSSQAEKSVSAASAEQEQKTPTQSDQPAAATPKPERKGKRAAAFWFMPPGKS